MNILYLADQYKPEYFTGTIKFAENLMKFFSKDNNIKLVAYSDNISDNHKLAHGVKCWHENVDGIECIKFNLQKKKNIDFKLFDEDIYKFAVDVIKEFNPDIIHICHPRRVASFMQAAIDMNKAYVITFTDSFIVCPNFFLFTKSCNICLDRHKEGICKKECNFEDEVVIYNRNIAKRYVDNAIALITPSGFQARIYSEYFDRKCFIINHGNNNVDQQIDKYKKVYPKQKLIFGFNGNSSTLKGLSVAISAFNKLDNNLDVELHIHGNCDDTTKLVAGNNVKFFGAYDNNQLGEILQKIDVLIVPSICYENYPFVISEAFAHKVPVIATNEGGMKELVKNFINGFTFHWADSQQLSEIITNLYYNQSIIQNFINNLSNYKVITIEDEMMEYEKIYSRCIEEKSLDFNEISNMEKIWIDNVQNKYKINIEYYVGKIEKILNKHNYVVTMEMKYRFILRLNNMEVQLKNKRNKSIIIWGSGTSAILTIDILQELYDWIEIKFVVDKFKSSGEIEGIEIRNIEVLQREDFDYLFVCTSPGKKEADKLMNKFGKNINIDYNYGICVD